MLDRDFNVNKNRLKANMKKSLDISFNEREADDQETGHHLSSQMLKLSPDEVRKLSDNKVDSKKEEVCS